jgi:hypothetical protein
VRILRSNRALSRTPVLYDPGIVIVARAASAVIGGECYLYDEAITWPSGARAVQHGNRRHAERPLLLALYLHLDFTLAAELAAQIDREGGAAPVQAPRSMMSTPMDEAMHASVLRFSKRCIGRSKPPCWGRRCCANCISACSPARRAARCEARWRCAAVRPDRPIAALIHADYAQALDVTQLAAEAGMSVPSFHSHFKAITQASPMQYLEVDAAASGASADGASDLTAGGGHAVGYTSRRSSAASSSGCSD